MRRFAFALFALIFATTPAAHAQKRVALVIGNSAYQHTAKLTNPRNDATDMAAALKKHGFQVIEGFDLNKVEFERKVRDFSRELQGTEAGVFFYAGHGMQVAGHNYLVPIDAKAETTDALDWEMLRLDLVHRTMERAANTNIIFLDACRDNPLARNLARAMGTRSSDVGRGLAVMEVRRRYTDQFLHATRQRRARRIRPQLAVCRRTDQATDEGRRRPERRPDRRPQRCNERDAEEAGALGAFGPDWALLFWLCGADGRALKGRARATE